MDKIPFPELAERIQQHFAAQTYTDGLTLASQQITHHPEEYPTINYWRICLAALVENFDLANKFLETTLASGFWLSETLLRQSPSLKGIQGNGEFERLAEISAQMREVDGAEVPLLAARPEDACHPGEDGCRAVIFLHANMDTALNNLQHWGHLSSQGWLVITPQSSQALWTGAYMWPDYPTAKKELEDNYQRISSQYSLDESHLVWGGFSMGAEIALEAVLRGDFPSAGFVLLGPAGPKMNDLDEWQPLIDQAAGRDLKGVILMGEADDTIPQENIRLLVERLNAAGISTRLQTFPDLEHDYPEAFESLTAELVAEIVD